MPVTLTDDPSTFQDIQAPTAGDGRDAVSMVVPLQRLANRTRQTKNRIDAIAPAADGVRVLRTVASIAALQAIGATDHLDDTYAVVEDYGLYRYDINSLETASTPFVVQPTDVVGGGTPGRWHLCAAGKSALNTANGVAQCDSAGRVSAGSVRNGIVAYGHVEPGSFSTNSISFVDITGSAITIPGLLVGDVVVWDYVFADAILAVSSSFVSQGLIVRPDATTALAPNMGFGPNNTSASVSLAVVGLSAGTTYVCTQSGTHVFKVQMSSSNSAATQNVLAMTSRVLVMRP